MRMITINAGFGYELTKGLSARERFRLIKQAGFGGVLLGYGDGAEFRGQDIPGRARDCGLYAENVHAPFHGADHFWRDDAQGRQLFETWLRCVDDCAAHGVPTIVMHPMSIIVLPWEKKLGLERFRRIVARAEEKGVNLALENLGSGMQHSRAALLLEAIPSPRLGMCFDAGHHNVRLSCGLGMKMLARFGRRLMALHLHDNSGWGDQHRLPFDGSADWPEIMRAIAAAGFQGPVTLEVFARGPYYAGVSAVEFLARAYERAKRLEALLHA